MNKAVSIWIKTEDNSTHLFCFDGEKNITDEIIPELKEKLGDKFNNIVDLDIATLNVPLASTVAELMECIEFF